MSNPDNIKDEFRGDSVSLRASILALIQLDDANALVPHGIGGHARSLLASAYHRLATSDAAYRRGVEDAAKVVEDHKPKNVPSDWTEYARDKNATCEDIASAIRTLSPAGDAPAVGVGEPKTATFGSHADGYGSPYIRVAVEPNGEDQRIYRVSLGGAEVFAAELVGLLDNTTSPSPTLTTSADAEARGYAAGIEAAAKVAEDIRTDDDSMWDRAAEEIATQIAALATKEVGTLGTLAEAWISPKSNEEMPAKPGLASYEYVECLVLYRGQLLARPWNCEHKVFDDEEQDDHFCEWHEITAYRVIGHERELAVAASQAIVSKEPRP